ncbi:hypothetical protein N0V88_007362 [Collariella sp. IMI 366227]|nr:hypothetical protein N0V88_007362 [Collariella sp. IMI 366227]
MKMIVKPAEKQHPDIQGLGINVAKLETVAMESLSAWFDDHNKPRNAKKRPILKELFRVAKMQEKFMRDEIDPSTPVFITQDDMLMDCCFDQEDEEEKDDKQVDLKQETPCPDSLTARASPLRAMLPALQSTGPSLRALVAQMHVTPFMPATQFPAAAMGLSSNLAAEHYPYAGTADLASARHQLQPHPQTAVQMHDLLITSPARYHPHHDASRRPSVFAHSDFAGLSPHSALYGHSPWSTSGSLQQQQQQQPTSTTTATSTPDTSPIFAYNVAQHHHQQQQQGVRWPDQVIMFDGTSEKPSDRLHEDRHRGIRLQRLHDAVKGQVAQLGIPNTVYVSQHRIVSHTNKTYSATSCLAWAEAKFQRWPISHFWDEFEHPCWMPSTNVRSEFAEMIVNDLKSIEVLGIEQIDKDYPPLGSDIASNEDSDGDSDDAMDEDSSGGSGGGSGEAMDEDSSGGSSGGSGEAMDEDSGGGSGDGPSPGLGSDSSSARTRSTQRLIYLPDHKDHAAKARQAGIPHPTNRLTDPERRLLLEYTAASACLPTITRGLSQANLQTKVTGLVDWFASLAKSQNIPVGSALVFVDFYLSCPDLDFVAYFLDKDYRNRWHNNSPDARTRAAKRLDSLWSLALNPAEAAGMATSTNTTSSGPTSEEDFFKDVIDPFDNMPSKGKVIGIHMTKKSTLGVRLPSLSTEYPDLGRGVWVDCKSGKEVEAYNQYIKTFPNKGKLSSADESLLAACKTPADFELDSVFKMKWGKTFHIYGYGRPTKGDLHHPLMFSKTTLSKVFKKAATMEMLQTHSNRTGQASYEGEVDAQPEVISLRARRSVGGLACLP